MGNYWLEKDVVHERWSAYQDDENGWWPIRPKVESDYKSFNCWIANFEKDELKIKWKRLEMVSQGDFWIYKPDNKETDDRNNPS